jgi:hypothetical protein
MAKIIDTFLKVTFVKAPKNLRVCWLFHVYYFISFHFLSGHNQYN